MNLDGEVVALRERLATDTPFWAANCVWVLDDRRRPVRLVARPWQARTPETLARTTPLDEALERQRLAGLPQRVLICKARKLGFSTWTQAKLIQRCTQLPYQYAVSSAQNTKTAGVLMDMGQFMHERLPNDLELGELIYGRGCGRSAPFSIKPPILGSGQTRNGSRWMTFGHKLRRGEACVYETVTAGAKAVGRGFTPSMYHGSEVAWYDDSQWLVGMLNSVPKLEGTLIVLESTANGFNHFYDRWMRAKEGAEDPDTGGTYVPLFYGWQDNPANAMAFVDENARARFVDTIGDPKGGGDEEEEWLVEEFGCTPEQLRWRRVTVSEDCEGNIDVFHQEHPATDQQAFIGSGRPYFAGILVSRMISIAERAPAPVEGVLRGADWSTRQTRAGTVRVPGSAVWVPAAQMTGEDVSVWGRADRLVVWEHPLNAVSQDGLPAEKRKPDSQHVVFADIAQGSDGTLQAGDFNAVCVLDHVSKLQVARYRSRIALHDYPLVLLLIAVYFNQAVLAPEVTGLGIGVVDKLHKDYAYPYLYRRRRAGDDQRRDQREHLMGWQTDGRTKPLMEATFGQALKDESHGVRDIVTAREFTTYVVDDRGNHGAQKGSYDDLLMAMMGARRVAEELAPRPEVKRRGRMRGWTTG